MANNIEKAYSTPHNIWVKYNYRMLLIHIY